MPLSNAQQKILRRLHSRQGRKKSPFFVVEGLRCCQEALTHQPDWVEFVVTTAAAKEDLPSTAKEVLVDEQSFIELAQTENPQGVLAVMRRPETEEVLRGNCVLVLDRLADPGNVGTILRTAWAVGLQTVVWTAGTCDPFGPKAVRAGMGAQFVLNLPQVEDLAALSQWPDRTIWIGDVRDGASCFDDAFDVRTSFLVVGNEAGGSEIIAGARPVHIPMPGHAESLNVAQAATVLLFEALRREQL